MIVGASKFTGMLCTAVTKLPPNTKDMYNQDVGGHWITDLPGQEGIRRWCVRPRYLLRIDDPDHQQQILLEKAKDATNS